jgi:hypothetical protein
VPSNPPKPGFAAFRAAPADAFDLWLRDDLQRLYSAVAAEPVPPELLRLLDGATEAAEHWRLASAIQAGHEAGHGADGKARRGGRGPFRAGRI